jgi:hypothetical protein
MSNIKSSTAPMLYVENAALIGAKSQLDRASRRAALEKALANKTQLGALVDALEGRRNAGIELSNRTSAFPDLFRNAWLTFVKSPSRSNGVLVRNLDALREFAAGEFVPSETTFGSGEPFDRECRGVQGEGALAQGWVEVGDCVILMPGEGTRIVSGIIDSEPDMASVRLPLLVVAPFSRGTKVVNVTGFIDIRVE